MCPLDGIGIMRDLKSDRSKNVSFRNQYILSTLRIGLGLQILGLCPSLLSNIKQLNYFNMLFKNKHSLPWQHYMNEKKLTKKETRSTILKQALKK